ncbi:MAG: thiamine phosphate synthase [Parvularculaceae bacterium]
MLAAAADALKERNEELGGKPAPFSLAFLTDRRRVQDPASIIAALPAGAAVIYRDYEAPDRAEMASNLLAKARARGVFFLIAGDAAIADELGADGVHWPARLLSASPTRRRGLLTASCHNSDELGIARSMGADAVFLSPVFATKSHPHAVPLGAAAFKSLAAKGDLPVIALGGVDWRNTDELAGVNVAGFAAIGAFAG